MQHPVVVAPDGIPLDILIQGKYVLDLINHDHTGLFLRVDLLNNVYLVFIVQERIYRRKGTDIDDSFIGKVKQVYCPNFLTHYFRGNPCPFFMEDTPMRCSEIVHIQ